MKKKLEESKINLSELKESLSHLIKVNRELEEQVRILLVEKRETKMETNYIEIDLTRDKKNLQGQVDILKGLNDDLRGKINDYEKKLEIKNKELKEKEMDNEESEGVQKENELLRGKLGDMQNQIDFYQKRLDDQGQKSFKNERGVGNSAKYNQSDFLKCMYGQASYIESLFQPGPRKSYI